MKQENECYTNDWELIPFNSNIEMLSGFPFDSNNFNDNKGTPLIRIRNIISGNTETFYDGDFSLDFLIRKGTY
jgi:type I restriction enzyme S subunit